MQQAKTFYLCANCGREHRQWQGQCAQCNQWNTLKEETRGAKPRVNKTAPVPQLLRDIQWTQEIVLPTGIAELDRVLGGGLVAGSIILIGGHPGAGKSTLLLQALSQLACKHKVCYVSGEESLNQILMHAKRLKIQHQDIHILAEKNLESILAAARVLSPQVLVVDSIQVIHSAEHPTAAGGVSQVRECTLKLMEYAKSCGCVVIIIGHVTKEGVLAGPKVLEHTVDTSLLLESTEDTRYRTLRAHKNRFGAINEIGLFAMTENGMRQVRNPSAIFLSRNKEPVLGSATAVVREGSRSLLVEIQALVDTQVTAYPRRVSAGLDAQRVAILLAVLSCHCSLNFTNSNVFINVAGGLRIEETGTDLPCLLALVSIVTKRFLPAQFASFGEVGLNGEIRPQPYGQERIAAAQRHGFTRILVPQSNLPRAKSTGIDITPVQSLSQALSICFSQGKKKKEKKDSI